jgi:hypothetical protein
LFSANVTFFALLVAYLLSDLLRFWLVVPAARGLGFFLAVLSFTPFVRKREGTFWQVLALALLWGGVALIWSVILRQLRLE